MIGIYGIHNTINDKWYVGQSQDIQKRNARERYNLNHGFFHWGSGSNSHIVAAWEKYGPDAFEWTTLEECGVSELDEREQYWISEKDSFRNGYNRTIGGGGLRGFKASAETRRKISQNHADVRGLKNPMYGKVPSGEKSPHWGKKHSEESRRKMRDHHADVAGGNNPRARGVEQYSLDGVLLRTWDCVSDAAKSLGINHRNISAVCLHKRKTAGGYRWRYKEREEKHGLI